MSHQIELSKLYRIRFEKKALPTKKAIWKTLCENFFQKHLKKTDTVVDVACGYGEFINNIDVARRIAVDLNPDAKNHLTKEVEFHLYPATKLSQLGQNIADAIFTSNFLEHLPDKATLDTFLDQVMLTLKPGGRYLILGPNLRYLPGKYWDFYDHHLGLTHMSLCEALRLKGFNIEICIAKFLPYTTQGKLPTHPLLVWLYLKCPLVWPFLGKQFFIIASKPL